MSGVTNVTAKSVVYMRLNFWGPKSISSALTTQVTRSFESPRILFSSLRGIASPKGSNLCQCAVK